MSDEDRDDPIYDETIRDLVASELEGRVIVGITQHDKNEFLEDGRTRVELHLDNGSLLAFYSDGDIELRRSDGTSSLWGLVSRDDDDDDEGDHADAEL